MTRLRDDPTWRETIRWYAHGIFWPGLFMVAGLIALMIWSVVR